MLGGLPTIFGIDPYTTETSSSHQLGTIGVTPDGRRFRYFLNGAVALVAGKVIQGPAEDATNQSPAGGLAVGAAAIGTNQVTLTGSLTLAANLLAGGYMNVVAGTGGTLGQSYKVKSNTAVAGAAGCVVTLEHNIVGTAFTTSTKVTFHKSPYDSCVIAPATLTAAPVGVPQINVPIANYAWAQTGGPASAFITGTFATAGLAVGVLVGGTIGSLAPAIAGTNVLGYTMGIGATGEYDAVFLTID